MVTADNNGKYDRITIDAACDDENVYDNDYYDDKDKDNDNADDDDDDDDDDK